MAPTVEQIVGDIKSSIEKLEHRMSDLEARVEGKASGAATSHAMRMILMGPPGAGTSAILNKMPFGNSRASPDAGVRRRSAMGTSLELGATDCG